MHLENAFVQELKYKVKCPLVYISVYNHYNSFGII